MTFCRLMDRCRATARITVSRLMRMAGCSPTVGSGARRIRVCRITASTSRADTRFCNWWRRPLAQAGTTGASSRLSRPQKARNSASGCCR
ncbi:hypothetical protein D3C80_1843500 [compost metagenome]